MPLLMICSVRGRPGVTTTAIALAACCSAATRPVLVECDPAGGDLLRRHRLAARPSLVDLAAVARTASTSGHGTPQAGTADRSVCTDAVVDPFGDTSQRIHLRDQMIQVVAAPAGGAQTRAALPELIRSGEGTLNPPDRLIIADCGRLGTDSPCRALLELADLVMVVARPRSDELAHLCERLPDLVDHATGGMTVLLTADGQYGAAEVQDVLTGVVVEELAREPEALRVTGPLPVDRRAAAILGGDLLPGRRWQRLPLLVAAGRLLDEVAPHLVITIGWAGAGR